VAQVVINEVDADQVGTDGTEFIELYDGGVGNTPVTGIALVLYNGSSDTVYASFDLVGMTNAAGFFLCGPSNFPGGVDFIIDNGTQTTNLIQNGADAVTLYLDTAANFPVGAPLTTTNLIDALVYDTNDSDDLGLLVLTPGQPQVNEGGGLGGSAVDSNSRCPDGGMPLVTTTFAQTTPTPGAPNQPVCAFFDHDIVAANIPGTPDSNVTFSVTNGTPMNTVYLAATSVNANQIPTGWFFGVNMTIGELITQLNTGNPYVGVLDASGNYNFVLPLLGVTFPLPVSIALDTVAIEFDPTSILQSSAAKTLTF
jgi:hypothetical protein